MTLSAIANALQRARGMILFGLIVTISLIFSCLIGLNPNPSKVKIDAKVENGNKAMVHPDNVTYHSIIEGLTSTNTFNTPEDSKNTNVTSSGANTTSTSFIDSAIQGIKNYIMPSTSASSPKALPVGAVMTPSWKQLDTVTGVNTAGRVLCYPKTGQEVVEMVSAEFGSLCEILILLNDEYTPYSIRTTMNVSTPKLLIGRPLRMPMLNSTNRIPRLFNGR